MKERTKNAFKKLFEITSEKCKSCPATESHRCCDKLFCNIVESDLQRLGIFFPKPNVGKIPYMGEKGCIVPPELRPRCTGYICSPFFSDRDFRREYDRLIEKINQDPEVPPMPKVKK